MAIRILFLLLAISANQWTVKGIAVDNDLVLMKNEVENQTILVTSYAANENPNTLTEQKELATILNRHVQGFTNAYDDDLNSLVEIIEQNRQNANIGSAKSLCYKLQLTKIDPAREKGQQRTVIIKEQVEQEVNDLVESTRNLIDATKLDLDVKTIVQLCMKIYSAIGEDKQRLQCFDEYGAYLSITQKSKGETLLERVGTIQQQTLRISDKTDKQLRAKFAEDSLDFNILNQGQLSCKNLPDTRRIQF